MLDRLVGANHSSELHTLFGIGSSHFGCCPSNADCFGGKKNSSKRQAQLSCATELECRGISERDRCTSARRVKIGASLHHHSFAALYEIDDIVITDEKKICKCPTDYRGHRARQCAVRKIDLA